MAKKREFGLYLLNDDINSYEYIIYVLMTCFGWDDTQAINCATIAGDTGQCLLKSFQYEEDAFFVARVLESKNLTIKIKIND